MPANVTFIGAYCQREWFDHFPVGVPVAGNTVRNLRRFLRPRQPQSRILYTIVSIDGVSINSAAYSWLLRVFPTLISTLVFVVHEPTRPNFNPHSLNCLPPKYANMQVFHKVSLTDYVQRGEGADEVTRSTVLRLRPSHDFFNQHLVGGAELDGAQGPNLEEDGNVHVNNAFNAQQWAANRYRNRYFQSTTIGNQIYVSQASYLGCDGSASRYIPDTR